MAEMMVYIASKIRTYKNKKGPQLPSWVCSLYCLDRSFLGKQVTTLSTAPHAHMARNWRFHSRARREQRPASNHMSEHGNRFISPQMCIYLITEQLDSNLMRNWGRTTQLEHYWIPDAQNLWGNKYFLF